MEVAAMKTMKQADEWMAILGSDAPIPAPKGWLTAEQIAAKWGGMDKGTAHSRLRKLEAAGKVESRNYYAKSGSRMVNKLHFKIK